MRPLDYNPAIAYPLVLFLHGAGQRGHDNEQHLINGLEVFADPGNREKFPAFVVAPQCPLQRPGSRWGWCDSDPAGPAAGEPAESILREIVHLEDEFFLDVDRFYITGISMGGYATWELIMRYPDLFAAAVPVCGGGDPNRAGSIAELPLWAFHGAIDEVVSVSHTRQMVHALEQLGGHPRYTEYPEVAHDSWHRAYREPELLPWLFSQSRSKP